MDARLDDLTVRRKDKNKLYRKATWSQPALDARLARIASILGNKKKKPRASTAKQLKAERAALKSAATFLQRCPMPAMENISFAQVEPIIQSKCMGCHATNGNWTNTSEWFLATGKVAPGDPSNSILYTYLQKNPEGYSPGTMPKDLSALTRVQIAKFNAWIIKLGQGVVGDRNPAYACTLSSNSSGPTKLMRLARVEYVNAILDLLSAFSTADQTDVKSEIQQAINLVPADLAQRQFLGEQVFTKLDVRVQQEHIDAWKGVAQAFGAATTSTSTRVRIFSLGNCVPTSNGAGLTCLQNFITSFGRRIYRRPLTGTESSDLETFFSGRPSASAFGDLIARMLIVPAFLYHIEVAGTLNGELTDGSTDTYTINAYELASRLSFLFWQSIPTDALLDAAASGELLTNFDSLVDSIFFAEPGLARTKATVDDFFIDWLGLERIPAINPDDSLGFAAFTAGEQIPVGGYTLRGDAEQEILSMVDYHTWQSPGTLRDLLLTEKAYSNSSALSHLYGASPVLNDQPQAMPVSNRAGILLRAATLISGNRFSNPAKRGARFLRDFLCEDLPDPDPVTMSLVKPPPEDPTLTTRQRFTRASNSPACTGCHVKINPIGFALEDFDALGRHRTAEKVYSNAGALLTTLPINSKVGAVFFTGDVMPVEGGMQLMNAAVESGKVQACVAKKYFEFAFRRHPATTGDDGCTLEAMRQALISGNLQSFFRGIVSQPAFRKRRMIR